MKLAGDDADGDLALALGERVMAGMEMGAERPRDLRQLRIMHPDFARPGEPATALDHGAITLLLCWCHLLVGNLGITTEGWCVRHLWFLLRLCVHVLGPSDGETSSARRCNRSSARLSGIQWTAPRPMSNRAATHPTPSSANCALPAMRRLSPDI